MYHQNSELEMHKSEADASMSKKLLSMWTRFAAQGDMVNDVSKAV